jgi:pimeloyl-ACP methyl ester carboxylesterase
VYIFACLKLKMKTAQQVVIFLLRAKVNLQAAISTQWAVRTAFRIFSTPYRKPRPVAPPIFEQSTEVQLKVNNLNIYGYCWHPERESKVLIIHGFESRAYNFDRYIQPLIKAGYGVYAMDAKAHGKSQGKTITVPEYVDMLRTLEEKVGKFSGYMAHSFGGLAISLYQEEGGNEQARVVLIAPATETSSAIDLFARFFKISEKVKSGINQYIIDKSGKPPAYYSINRAMQHIKNPVLWIHDQDDDITPLEDVKLLIENNQNNIEFMITKGLGHRRIYKDNNVVKKTISFLAAPSLHQLS